MIEIMFVYISGLKKNGRYNLLLAQKRLTRTEENIYFVNRPKIGQILSDFPAIFGIITFFYLTFQLLEEKNAKILSL